KRGKLLVHGSNRSKLVFNRHKGILTFSCLDPDCHSLTTEVPLPAEIQKQVDEQRDSQMAGLLLLDNALARAVSSTRQALQRFQEAGGIVDTDDAVHIGGERDMGPKGPKVAANKRKRQ